MKTNRIFSLVKSVRIRSYSGPHFPEFGLNTERYGLSLRIQSECGKMRAKITPNTHTFLRSAFVIRSSFEKVSAVSHARLHTN